jgi:hypothetical protein
MLSKVHVKFGDNNLSYNEQCKLLFEFEKFARVLYPDKGVEIFMDRMGDDSKLRVKMTPEQRNTL